MKNNLIDIRNKIESAFGKYTFIEDGHYYLCNGKRVGISTTGLIAQYEQKFDSDIISQQVANKRGVSQEKVLEEWRIENLHSTIKGSFIHEFAQSLWESKECKFDYSKIPKEIDIDRLKNDIAKLIPQAINFYNDYKDIYELIGCEIYLGDEEYDECGATDQMMLNKNTGEIVIIDYKTNKKIEYESFKHKKMLVPLHEFDDCNYIHYSFQLNDYKYKFEKYEDLFTVKDNCKIITLRNTGIEAKTDPDGNNYDVDNSIIKICEKENNGLKEKVSYILLKSTTTETDKRVRGIFDNNSSDKTVKVDSLGTKDVLDLKDLK